MDNIYLVGYRAVGKTTLGRLLAQNLNRPFVDADEALEAEQGAPITRIVETRGWAAFRALEKDLIHRLSQKDQCVIAPGGGAVLDPDNVRRMRETGLVAWLKASPETIGRRMAADPKTPGQRPSLTGQGVLEEIAAVLAERAPLYEKAAHLALDAEAEDAETLSRRIIEKTRNRAE